MEQQGGEIYIMCTNVKNAVLTVVCTAIGKTDITVATIRIIVHSGRLKVARCISVYYTTVQPVNSIEEVVLC